jgi:hypothetical protein
VRRPSGELGLAAERLLAEAAVAPGAPEVALDLRLGPAPTP